MGFHGCRTNGLERHGHRRGIDLGAVPLDQAHGQSHPLLAAWGRQGRDFIRLLDAFDDAETARQRFQIPRIDLFDEGDGDTLLAQVQSEADLGADFGGGLTAVEADWLVSREWAITADDILMRRTKIGLVTGTETRTKLENWLKERGNR